ncbi:CHAT domain-containing protein [Kordia sp.]|uniref:CHAT domain-containing protein n=1 Tax=Kordia sp. TaxID=1965332 RepID=UPI003B592E81
MKKIILCIIISCLFSSQQFLHAQETPQNILKTVTASYNAKNYTECISLTEKAIEIVSKNKNQLDSLSTANLYFYKGASEYYLQRFDVSIASYNKAISYCPTSDEGLNYKAELYYERAFSEHGLGSYLDSYESSKKAASIMETVQHPNYDYVLSIYADIAGSAADFGFQEEAYNYLNKAQQLYATHKNSIKTAKSEASKPVLFQYKAVEIINNKSVFTDKDIATIKNHVQNLEALKRQKRFNSAEKRMYAVALNMLGDAYLRKETVTNSDCKLAHKNLNKALQNLEATFFETHYYQFQFNKVKAFQFEKKYAQSLRFMNALLARLPKNDTRLSYFEAEKANILIALDDKEEVIRSLEKSIAAIHAGKNPLKKEYSNFVPSYDLNETGLLVKMAAKIVEKYPKDATVLSLASKMYKLSLIQFENCYREERFNDKLTTYYQSAVGGILKLKKLGYGHKDFNIEILLNRMEIIENRLAWKKFHQSRLLNEANISDTLVQKEQTIRKALVLAKRRKDTAAIFDYEQQLKQQLATLKQQFPNIATFAFETFDIKKIQATMKPSQVIVKYKKMGNQLIAFKITSDRIDFYELANSASILADAETYYNQISKQQENKEIAHTLYKKLFPFNMKDFTAYTIIPDNVLHYLPFETLITDNNQYLVENAAINYATHLVFVNHTKYPNQTLKNDDIVVFTPQYQENEFDTTSIALRDNEYRLYGAESESKLLTSIFPSRLFESIFATKDNFIKYSRKAKIIHLAMHANINNETPELSHLVFNENDNDSKMYIEELYGLHLNSDLAVLSACNTGKGKIDASKGMVSLNRAFTLAGVPSTVASLWEVPDKVTQKIMVDFYKNLKKGESKATALQNAKVNYLKNTDDANFQKPFYWAGFVLHGDSAPIQLEQEASFNFICIIAAILSLMIIVIVSFRIRKNTLKLF